VTPGELVGALVTEQGLISAPFEEALAAAAAVDAARVPPMASTGEEAAEGEADASVAEGDADGSAGAADGSVAQAPAGGPA